MVLGVPILRHFRVVWLGEHAKFCHASSNTEKAFIQKCTSVALNLVKIYIIKHHMDVAVYRY